MDSEFEEAFYEVDEILKTIPQKLLEKIPKSFRDTIKENISTTYKRQINGVQDIKNLKKETRVILYYIYRDFLSSEEECEKMKREEIKITEEKYSYENLFLKKENKVKDASTDEANLETEFAIENSKELVEYESQKWYMKIIKLLNNIVNMKTK